MKKSLLLFVWLVFVTGCQPKTMEYVHYHNERFGFELDYPSFMTMDPPPENGDGISCRGKGLELTAYGGLDMTWMDLDDTGLTTRDLYPQARCFMCNTILTHLGRSITQKQLISPRQTMVTSSSRYIYLTHKGKSTQRQSIIF